MHIRSFEDVERLLASKRPDIKAVNWFFALEDMQAFMNKLGSPQELPKVVHVAGTSGKTSTCYYLAEFFRLSNASIGLTVSPHVTDVSERLQINGELLPADEYLTLFQEFIALRVVESMDITYFGLLVAFAYWVIAKRRLVYAVIEVGMGGRLDATNVIDNKNKTCVITDIGLDHTQYLGTTRPEIAKEKAGIIQPGNHVFVAEQESAVMQVFSDVCIEKQATLHVMPDKNIRDAPKGLSLFQRRNWSLARFTFEYVAERDNLSKLNSDQLLKSTQLLIPARMEEFEHKGKTIIVDVSHNAQKITALSAAIKQKYPNKDVATLISMVEGKDTSLPESLAALHEVSDYLVVTRFKKSQDMARSAIEPTIIVGQANKAGFSIVTIQEDPLKAFAQLLESPEDVLLVTGSFFLINHVYPILKDLE